MRPEIDIDKYNDIIGHQDNVMPLPTEDDLPPARFCCTDCRIAYREDRIEGKVFDRALSAQLHVCTYCSLPLGS